MNKNEIADTLITVGVPINLKGFHYIQDAMCLLDKPEWKNPKWTALYHSIAILNNDNDSSVERNIRYALRTTRERNDDIDTVDFYIGYDNLSISNSLSILYTRIKAKECENVSNELRDKLINLLLDIKE